MTKEQLKNRKLAKERFNRELKEKMHKIIVREHNSIKYAKTSVKG